jgi:hypothetical protein
MLEMQVARSSEKSVNFYQTSECYITENVGATLHGHIFENLKPNYERKKFKTSNLTFILV